MKKLKLRIHLAEWDLKPYKMDVLNMPYDVVNYHFLCFTIVTYKIPTA